MHQIDPKESDNPGREGEVGCWESWHCWSISLETILWQCCHFITKSVCDSYSGKTPRNWRLQEESTRYFRWSSDRLKWQHRENEGLKDQVKNLQQHLGLLELRHTALAHYIVGIWNIWKTYKASALTLWQFGEGEQYHFLTGCLEVHWMYAIVFHWKYMLVCTKADGWASSFVDWPISFVHSILIKVCSCVPQFYFTSWVSSFAEVSGNLAWFACQPLKPSWNLHWSELVNVFTHTPAVSAVSKEEGWDSEAEAEEVNAVCAVKQKKGEKKGGNKLKLKL